MYIHQCSQGRHSHTLEKQIFKRHPKEYKELLIGKSIIKNKYDNDQFENKRQ